MSIPILMDYGSGAGHLDLDVQPPYLMVPENDKARVVVANDDDVFLKNEKQNEGTAIIEDKFMGANGRIYEVTPVGVGSTFINAYERKGGTRLAWRLQVDVKRDQPITVALHSVIADKYGDKTKRDSGVHLRILNLLNDIFKAQCNTSVNSTVSEDIKIDTSFDDVLREGQSNTYIRDHLEKMRAACDPNALFNIFFMPDPQATQLLDWGGGKDMATALLIFPDPMPDDNVSVALPHRIARAMSCPAVSNDRLKHYLMYYKRADGEGDVKPGGNVPFIGRDVVRQLNPYGSYR